MRSVESHSMLGREKEGKDESYYHNLLLVKQVDHSMHNIYNILTHWLTIIFLHCQS
jgi:hypothetical protein